MPAGKDTVVIGLTGPFGSGCTTSAKLLSEFLGFQAVSLSASIRGAWQKQHGARPPVRADLQGFGNELRASARDPGAVARLAINELKELPSRVVLDGIRNLGEVEYLRNRFGPNFYLIALECPASQRFGRLEPVYGRDDVGLRAFGKDNEADRDQETPFGQQVVLCVDASDALVINDDSVTSTELRTKLTDTVEVLCGERPRYPFPIETMMNFAYSAAHGSKCLKRQVGAVVVNADPGEMGDVVGFGFNENPRPTRPCVEEPLYSHRCYRDIVRQKSFEDLAKDGKRCPNCGAPMKRPSMNPPWKCDSCGSDLERFFWPERAMTLCTAIHAEVAALAIAGDKAIGSTLYTTTYPCFQCAEKIIQAGVRAIVFTEPYPDVRAAGRLELANISTTRFEGIRSRRFDEIFSRARPYVAAQRSADALNV